MGSVFMDTVVAVWLGIGALVWLGIGALVWLGMLFLLTTVPDKEKG